MQKLARDLNGIANKYIDETTFPDIKNGEIRVGQFTISQCRNGYTVSNHFTGELITETYLLLGALAVVKQASKGNYNLIEIKKADSELSRLYTDAAFLKHAADNAMDFSSKEVRLMRLELVENRAQRPKNFLRSKMR